jgi:integrase/recombinase XerD
MPDKPISPLRQRLIDDMTARRYSEKAQKAYVRHVRTFAAFLGRSPDTATSDDLRRFQLHMAQQQISPGSINAAIAALRFFFTETLERPDLVRPLRIVNEPRKAPVVLSQEEVARPLEAVPGLKQKVALSVAHAPACGCPRSWPGRCPTLTASALTLRVEHGQGSGVLLGLSRQIGSSWLNEGCTGLPARPGRKRRVSRASGPAGRLDRAQCGWRDPRPRVSAVRP